MPQAPTELDDELYQKIVALIEQGNVLVEESHDLVAANARYGEALALLPEPIERWDAGLWLLVALGDCHFLLGNYTQALDYLTHAIRCPDALGNGFIHLRLGQTLFELEQPDRAADELARAYMADGQDLFASQDPKYFTFIKTRMRGLP